MLDNNKSDGKKGETNEEKKLSENAPSTLKWLSIIKSKLGLAVCSSPWFFPLRSYSIDRHWTKSKRIKTICSTINAMNTSTILSIIKNIYFCWSVLRAVKKTGSISVFCVTNENSRSKHTQADDFTRCLPSLHRGTVTNNLFPQCSTPTGNAFVGMYVPDASATSFIAWLGNTKSNWFQLYRSSNLNAASAKCPIANAIKMKNFCPLIVDNSLSDLVTNNNPNTFDTILFSSIIYSFFHVQFVFAAFYELTVFRWLIVGAARASLLKCIWSAFATNPTTDVMFANGHGFLHGKFWTNLFGE